MENCIFCKIIKGELPSAKIYEDEETLAFLDIQPVQLGHALVIPKKHSDNFSQSLSEVINPLLHVCQKVGEAVKKGVAADGYNVSMNNGEAAGQIVHHLHFHVIPRYFNDGLKPWPHKKYKEGEMASVAAKITREL